MDGGKKVYMTYYTYSVEIYKHGRYLREKKNNNLITVDYIEISTKCGEFVYKVYDTSGRVHNASDLY